MVAGMHATEGRPTGTDAIDLDRLAYDISDTARLLSLSVRKVKYLISSGELASFKAGRARRVHGRAIREYMEREQPQPCERTAS